MTQPLDICAACGERPTCMIAEAAVLVVAKDYRGTVTSLCARCGAGEEQESAGVAVVGGGETEQEQEQR